MKKLIILSLLLSLTNYVFSQNKMGNTWLLGGVRAIDAKFFGVNKPIINIRYDNLNAGYPYYFTAGHSNICDSATGKLLFACNGMVLYDTSGNILNNGDSLVPNKIYSQNAYPNAPQTQGSLILPKGSNGEYYAFIPTVSDSLYNALWTPDIKTPFDELRYNVVNMNLNGGLGAVTVKNKHLLKNTEMVRTKMQACRHANGYDWWLLKQTGYGPNNITRFLVTKDSIFGPFIQNFVNPDWGQYDFTGQIAFSKDGKKFVSVQGKSHKVFIADFDRCSGELSSPKVFNIPIDSTTYPAFDNAGSLDSLSTGVCFSPNGQFVYISKWWNIYQFEYQVMDSSLAWERIQHGPDTSFLAFEYYGHLYKGPDDRIYIGKWGGSFKQFSVIDYPNIKGAGCGFCRKCFRLDDPANFGLTAPPNMPDFTLGADFSKPCWPLGNDEWAVESGQLEVYPNPASTILNIKTESKEKKELYNSVGQLLLSTSGKQIDVRYFTRGVYYLKCNHAVKKIIIE